MLNRRVFLTTSSLFLLSLWSAPKGLAMGFLGKKDEEKSFPFELTDKQWKEKLTREQYHVLREKGTERAFTSPLYEEKRNGLYHCVGCDHLLFSSEHKYESGTGWPSFWQPVTEDAIGLSVDYDLVYPRTEEHCANCGGHLGHVFDDGPQPTGKRHCINGVTLVFKPAA